jgi:pimeloyl-ACP methyl ester carboxylesterase
LVIMPASFILIPGAGGTAWYWHRVVPLLEQAGHRALAVDLPGDDEQAGLDAYVELTLRAIGDQQNVIVVAQSLGGFTAPRVCERTRVRGLVLVNAMIPLPGETAGAWWSNTQSEQAREQAAMHHGYSPTFDVATYFLHDVPEDVAKAGEDKQRPEAQVVFGEPCNFRSWPNVPIQLVIGADDRFFPSEFQQRVSRERLDKPRQEIAGGHLVALANPRALSDSLLAYERGL